MHSRATRPLAWTLGHHAEKDQTPETWIPATVPGAVQLDHERAMGWDPYWIGDNFRRHEWTWSSFWTYRSEPFARGDLHAGERLFLVSRGIDYQFEVRLNGALLHAQEGMFSPVELDLTARLAETNVLSVLIHPAPRREGIPMGRDQAARSCKPAVSYGWDFHPPLVPLGIWDETFLEIRSRNFIRRCRHFQEFSAGYRRVEVRLDYELDNAEAAAVRWELCGRRVTRRVDGPRGSLTLRLRDPRLWWPNGCGEQALHVSRLTLLDAAGRKLDQSVRRIGLREIKLVHNEGIFEEAKGWPKSRYSPATTVQVNGRRIFCKGSNWVPPSIFPGTVDRKTYRALIRRAAELHFNTLRCWAGGFVNKEAFFDLCDEHGLLVFQDFPIACTNPEDDPHYLEVLDRESRAIIERLAEHPSLALWSGGNELFNRWSGLDDQSLALRLLNRNCYDLDRSRPFLPTFPVMGMGHGHYSFRDMAAGIDVYDIFRNARCTAYTEFGSDGASSLPYIRKFFPEASLDNYRPGTAWESHHAIGAWLPDNHLGRPMVEHFFGPSRDLESLIRNSQTLQSEGLRFIYEERRRQKPYCAMAVSWCFNEPWPTAANCSILNWPHAPKPCFALVRDACRPVLASAAARQFVFAEGEEFVVELWLLNDSFEPVPAGVLRRLESGRDRRLLLRWDYPGTAANANLKGPVIRHRLPPMPEGRFTLVLENAEDPSPNSRYTFLHRSAAGAAARSGLLNQ